jgi:DNA/RNA-binding protein KIN17
MPKAEKGSVKDIANGMKARGLQKLKFYCQMCQKQCRDANGFKCHVQSESHMRQMKIFGDDASGFLKQYSENFEKSFLTTLRMRHGTKKVNANNIYQEVIADKQHIHMNATHWTTLSDFVQYLGRSKKCLVEENHSDGTGGWTVSYIERDAGILARRETQQRREAADKKAEEALLKRMKTQRIEAARALELVTGGSSSRVEATSILGDESKNKHKAPIKMGIASKPNKKNSNSKEVAKIAKETTKAAFGDDDEEDEDENDANDNSGAKSRKKPSLTNVERMMNETKRDFGATAPDQSSDPSATRKRRHDASTENHNAANNNNNSNSNKRSKQENPTKTKNERDRSSDSKRNHDPENWLYRGILVRVISKTLEGGKYFRKKAVVDRVLGDGFVAEVEVLGDQKGGVGDGDILRLDQSDLETVVSKLSRGGDDPKKFKKVRILRGKFKGEKATVEYLDKTRYRADLVLWKGKGRDEGKLLRDVPYEDFSQIA